MGAASTASESEPGVSAHDRGNAIGGATTHLTVRKPKALRAGSRLAVIAPASPGHKEPELRGVAELLRLGFSVELRDSIPSEGYFAAPVSARRAELLSGLRDPQVEALISLRGGYGSNYLLDELLGALDRKLREHTQFELINIQQQLGVTFVVVTHDQEEAMTLATRIGVMDHGEIVQVGTPRQIYEFPQTRFVADFIGSVNLFEGRLVEDEPDFVRVQCPELPATVLIDHGKLVSNTFPGRAL